MKHIISLCTILFMSFIIFSSCDDSTNHLIDKPIESFYDKKGYIKLYSKEHDIELCFDKIHQSSLIDGSTQKQVATIYQGYFDYEYKSTLNSISLYIDDIKSIFDADDLYGITFIYSKKGSNWGSNYRYFREYAKSIDYPNESSVSIENDSIIKGFFKGTLFDGVNYLVVDSCIFEFEK